LLADTALKTVNVAAHHHLPFAATMAHHPSAKVFLQAGLLASLIWGVGGQVQANSSNEGIANNVITAAAICGPWQPAEVGCIDATKLANSSLHFDGTQSHRSGFQYGYYHDGEFHTFDDSAWTGDAWKSAIGGFKGSEGWLTAENHPSGKQLTRRWVSNINGGVKLTNHLTVTGLSGENVAAGSDKTVKVTVLVDGEPEHTFEAKVGRTTEYNLNKSLRRGSTIDFLIESDDGTNLEFNLLTDISLQSGIAIKKNLQTTRQTGLVYPAICFEGECGDLAPLNESLFAEKYKQSERLLGLPLSLPYPTKGISIRGWRQDFEHGSIFQVLGSRTIVVSGDSGKHYLNSLTGERGSLGFPLSEMVQIGYRSFSQSFEGGLLKTDGFGNFEVLASPPLSRRILDQITPGSLSLSTEVGLLNQTVVESSSYSEQDLDDALLQKNFRIQSNTGVQQQSTFGAFIQSKSTLSTDNLITGSWLPYPFERTYSLYSEEIIPIKEEYVEFMNQKAQGIMNGSFLDTSFTSYPCAIQKGTYGAYSNVGLIEWLSEGNMALNQGEGFLSNILECYTQDISSYTYDEAISLSSESANPRGVTDSSVQPSSNLVNLPAFLSAEFLEYAIKKELWKYQDNWLRIVVEADEFTLTDPNGFKLSYSYTDGFKNEITDAFFERKDFFEVSPGSPLPPYVSPTSGNWGELAGEPLCDPNEEEEGDNGFPEDDFPFPQPHPFRTSLRKSQFFIFIPKRVEGKYTLEVASNRFKPQVVFGDKDSTTLITPDTPCDDPPPNDPGDPGNPDPGPGGPTVPGDPGPGPGITPNPGGPGVPEDPGNPTPDPKKPTPTPYIDIIITPPGTPKPEPVPEPSQAVGLLAAALMGGWWLKRRRS
jgi:hypothetical protein